MQGVSVMLFGVLLFLTPLAVAIRALGWDITDQDFLLWVSRMKFEERLMLGAVGLSGLFVFSAGALMEVGP